VFQDYLASSDMYIRHFLEYSKEIVQKCCTKRSKTTREQSDNGGRSPTSPRSPTSSAGEHNYNGWSDGYNEWTEAAKLYVFSSLFQRNILLLLTQVKAFTEL
jgi:hypothetical protein